MYKCIIDKSKGMSNLINYIYRIDRIILKIHHINMVQTWQSDIIPMLIEPISGRIRLAMWR